ncbi:hypothetical protein Q5425_03220 [Amycolatopsis sp. A133]|uniref:hypothetical protein n=1 Tax=Amycolatopsis sp. A133 TaxID=3064472 RepID=UPI0027FE6958|nr:hypothetical protein [Amycolatopsis sp. A133]MDQ7802725.1 hypothetical protein [Amycolatopsis sp. A133]
MAASRYGPRTLGQPQKLNIVEAGGSGIYRFVGGALVRLFNWGAIPGFDGGRVVDVNFQSLANLDHIAPVPADGSYINIVEAGGSCARPSGSSTRGS